MPETEVHRLTLPRDKLQALAPPERRLVFLLGHMANELQTLTRLLVFSLHKEWSNEIAERVAGGRANVVLRMLCGKLWESHELVRRRIQSDPIGRKYAGMLKGEAAKCYQRIRQQAGGEAGRILAALRNNHAYHFPPDDAIDAAFAAIDANEPMEVFLSPNGDATFYHASEVIIEIATMSVTAEPTLDARVNRIADIVVEATRDLVEFAGLMFGIILESQTDILDKWSAAEVIQAEYLHETVIPPVTVRPASE